MSANLKSFAFMQASPSLSSIARQEINRDRLFGYLFTESSHFLMLGMNRVAVKSIAIDESSDKTGIKRSFEVQDVGTDIES